MILDHFAHIRGAQIEADETLFENFDAVKTSLGNGLQFSAKSADTETVAIEVFTLLASQ